MSPSLRDTSRFANLRNPSVIGKARNLHVPRGMIDSLETAKQASLRYVTDAQPGITREKHGTGFSYHDANGHTIADEDVLKRIHTLAIPPAWSHVWIAPIATAHIQATGRDSKGRKQYRYHAKWHATRGETKFGRMPQFGTALPTLRAHVNTDLAKRDLAREKVLGVVVRLLETTYIRVGNEEYARTNGSFGLTTLRNRHVSVQGDTVRFAFKGKSGKSHTIRLSDRRLARMVSQCRDLPGQLLFQFVDDNGDPHPITSSEVNEYVREITGEDFTAKNVRTWAGTLLAAQALHTVERSGSAADAHKAQVAAVQSVASQLGNTPAVCRKGYIHPLVLNAYEDTDTHEKWLQAHQVSRARAGLTREESALLHFLEVA